MTERKDPARPTEPFPPDEYEKRLNRLTRKLARRKVDAFLVQTDVHRNYLTGFESSAGLLLVRPGAKPRLHTDFRYLEAARKQIGGFVDVRPAAKLDKMFAEPAKRDKWRRVGYEGSVPCGQFRLFRDALPDVEEWVNASPTVQALRNVKSPREQAVMRQAVAAADRVFAETLDRIDYGMTEWEVRRIIMQLSVEHGQKEGFAPIVCFGANASHCHHHPGDKVLRRNQPVLIDMGVQVQGYTSDMTRTVFFGKPSPKMREIYKIVLEANERAVAGVRAGATGGEIDARARDWIAKKGYGDKFGHGLGHGLGLEIHESARFAKGSDLALKSGMMLTVEPGVYLPGVGGVRIEDVVLVRPKGCEVVTATPRELTCL